MSDEQAIRDAIYNAETRKQKALKRYQAGPQNHAANAYALKVATEELDGAKRELQLFLYAPKPVAPPRVSSIIDDYIEVPPK